ncbi:CocE/NonD family hydrolase [Tardiphaga sp. 20_F10_N6_6]|uniref:CocE/NonD family hydrolase n=1 Tax=Tardiphaga sp. 20_F10_N6_6 TaxID=3240788 RepID=UPI003F8AA34A
MIIERDLLIPMDDGLQLRADVYRPDLAGPVPVIMTMGPYGKGIRYQDHHYKPSWDWMTSKHPDLLPGSQRRWLTWETVDPEIWVSWGYAVVRVDSRGAGRSPGFLDILSERETLDYYHVIEWAGVQPWSTGKVGLNGISYYAINQWHVAALQPPHLTAMIPWEGAADTYRDFFRHGGILSNKFLENWYPRQVLSVQHGNPDAPPDIWLNESSSGPEELSKEQLASNRLATLANARARELEDEWYRRRSPDWSKVITPFLSAANWAGYGLHPRGNFSAFTNAASEQKWLEAHPGRHEEWFYLEYGMNLQKRFFDFFLRGEQNGWDGEPRVWLHLRRPFTEAVQLRKEEAWPLPGTEWTKLYLDAGDRSLAWEPPAAKGVTPFAATVDHLKWTSPPLESETEFTGPLSLKLFLSSSTIDADVFVTLQAFAPDGREVEFQGTVDPHTPLAQGWLRASHRKLCAERSRPYQPYHTHDEKQPLIPGQIYELDVEIWPTCIVLPQGYRIALDIRGSDFARANGDAGSPHRGSGPWLHDDVFDRPAMIFQGTTTLYTGPEHQSHLLLPIVPNRLSRESDTKDLGSLTELDVKAG